jgi:hypothetical protein
VSIKALLIFTVVGFVPLLIASVFSRVLKGKVPLISAFGVLLCLIIPYHPKEPLARMIAVVITLLGVILVNSKVSWKKRNSSDE